MWPMKADSTLCVEDTSAAQALWEYMALNVEDENPY